MTRTLRALGALITACIALTTTAAAHAADHISYVPASGSVNVTDSVPPAVDPSGFNTLTSLVAGYWGLRIDGQTAAIPGDRDGTNAIGFSYALGKDTLGQYGYWTQRVYRWKRVCKLSNGHRSCHRVRRYQFTQVTESDIAFNATYNWNVGPGYPASDQMDLPTVAFHEFGHWADPNAPHEARCSGSPLTESTAFGEWWRGPGDWYEGECGNSPSFPSAKRTTRPAPRFRTVRRRLPDLVLGERRRVPQARKAP
jgi:hypothetical protein